MTSEAQDSIRSRLEEMRLASALVDEANDPTEYQIRLTALALITRQFLREPILDPHEAFVAAYLCGQIDVRRGLKRVNEAWQGWSSAKVEVLSEAK